MRVAKAGEITTRKPFAGLFPPSLPVAEAITADMREHGYDDAFPIIVWDGCVVDGHTRMEVAARLGCDVMVVDKEFGSVREALDYAVHCQKDRRNMTNAGMRAAVAAIREEEEAAAKARMIAGKPTDPTLASRDARVEPGRSCEKIAKTLGTSPATVDRINAIERGPEEIKEKVDAGEISITKGAELARHKEERQEEPRFIKRLRAALAMGEKEARENGLSQEIMGTLVGFRKRIDGILNQAACGRGQ